MEVSKEQDDAVIETQCGFLDHCYYSSSGKERWSISGGPFTEAGLAHRSLETLLDDKPLEAPGPIPVHPEGGSE